MDILQAAAQRLAQLSDVYSSQPLNPGSMQSPSLCDDAHETSRELANARAIGWSSRQRREIDLSGVVGTLCLSGLSPEATVLLQAATFFSLGKSTAYGCGTLVLEGLFEIRGTGPLERHGKRKERFRKIPGRVFVYGGDFSVAQQSVVLSRGSSGTPDFTASQGRWKAPKSSLSDNGAL